jgi:hypothetical protein
LKKILRLETEYSSYQLITSVFIKKQGLIIDITGPDDHLGGVGIGIPYIRKNGVWVELGLVFHIFGKMGMNLLIFIAYLSLLIETVS